MSEVFKSKNLYLVLSSQYNKTTDPIQIVEEAIAGGVDIVQLREKHLSLDENILLGKKILGLCSKNNVHFIVNDDPSLAKKIDAEGVHLGQEDLLKYPIAQTRKILGENKIIGLSTHNIEQVKQSQDLDVDYIAFGPIFKTQTKDYFIGVDHVEEVLSISKVPVVFIGGINLNNIDILLEKKVNNIAVIRSIIQAEDIKKAASQLKNKITGEFYAD